MSEISNSPSDPRPFEALSLPRARSPHDGAPTFEQLDDMRRFNEIFKHMSETQPADRSIDRAGGVADLTMF